MALLLALLSSFVTFLIGMSKGYPERLFELKYVDKESNSASGKLLIFRKATQLVPFLWLSEPPMMMFFIVVMFFIDFIGFLSEDPGGLFDKVFGLYLVRLKKEEEGKA